MESQTKSYIAVSAVFAFVFFGGAVWSNYKITKLENAVEAAKQTAISIQRSADEKEKQSTQYKQKIDYLDRELADIQIIARKQDEELEKFNSKSSRNRADVKRTRHTRSITATADELCAKLSEVGHPCE